MHNTGLLAQFGVSVGFCDHGSEIGVDDLTGVSAGAAFDETAFRVIDFDRSARAACGYFRCCQYCRLGGLLPCVIIITCAP